MATLLFAGAVLRVGDNFARRWESVETGLDRDQIRALLGEPDLAFPELEIDGPFLQLWHDRFGVAHERWVYERSPRGRPFRLYYTLLFDDGKVVDKTLRYLPEELLVQ